jgi:hypothetical protein
MEQMLRAWIKMQQQLMMMEVVVEEREVNMVFDQLE